MVTHNLILVDLSQRLNCIRKRTQKKSKRLRRRCTKTNLIYLLKCGKTKEKTYSFVQMLTNGMATKKHIQFKFQIEQGVTEIGSTLIRRFHYVLACWLVYTRNEFTCTIFANKIDFVSVWSVLLCPKSRVWM